MACFMVVIPTLLALLCVGGYLAEKIPDKVFQRIARRIFRCRL